MIGKFLNEQHYDFLRSGKSKEADTCTASTNSSEYYIDNSMEVHIDCQDTLDSFYDDLQQKGSSFIKSITMSFRQNNPYRKLSKLKKLEETFVAIGSLPHLEELVFHNADLMVSNIYKLLKKSSLTTLKFHNCTFVAKKPEHTDKVWQGIQRQTNLNCLEIVNCQYTASETLCRNRTIWTYEMPLFLHSSTIERLVLDECMVDSDSFPALLANTTLLELQIRPVFDVACQQRRQQYQAKKHAIHTFLTQVVTDCLSTNTTLRKLLINVDDYHLEHVYVDTMSCWIDLVQYDNSTLTDLRVTDLPLSKEQPEEPRWYQEASADSDKCFEYTESLWHRNLQSILRLNQKFGAQQQQEETTDSESTSVKDTNEAEQTVDKVTCEMWV